LRRRLLDLSHEGHQGIVKTKERLRSKVWWPGIDKEAEKTYREWFGCQMVSKHVPPPLIKSTRLPERASQEVAFDLLGPLPPGEHLLLLVDYFTRWMEVDVLRSTTSGTIIKCLDGHFARYGVPAGLRTDNGSNLVSEESEKYLEEIGTVHPYNTPLWPRATSCRMPRHIRDLNVESARDFKFNQAARWSNNKENDQKMADNAYLFRAYVLYTCVS